MKALASVMPVPSLRSRAADYIELTKPRVGVLVLFTVAAGALLAARGKPDLAILAHAVFGTALVVAGASAWNQFLERRTDGLMERTESRPLPGGRLAPGEVLLLGTVLGLAGVAYLAVAGQRLAALVAAAAFVGYVFVYTPLKQRSTLNTLAGAVPGALPPVIGWTAVRGTLDAEIIVWFWLLFLWQVPHFLAIAWIYREDYRRARLQMLPVVDERGTMTSRQMIAYCLALIPVSLAPAVMGLAGPIYWIGALMLGLGFLASAIGFSRASSVKQARRVLRASLVYLPAVMALLLVDGLLS